jgi:hypothetical protein
MALALKTINEIKKTYAFKACAGPLSFNFRRHWHQRSNASLNK